MILAHERLGIQQIELAGRARHEEEDHALGPCLGVRAAHEQRIGCRILCEKPVQGDGAEASGRAAEEVAPFDVLSNVHAGYSRVKNSSVFIRPLANMDHAAPTEFLIPSI